MKFIISGSGGCVCTPKPLCRCNVCDQARKKGFPYARCASSLYLEGAALLVDTPEDIAAALNNAGIGAVEHVLYTHWDPDHTMGMRVFEQLRLEWLDAIVGIKPVSPVAVHAQKSVMDDVNAIRNKFGSFLDYYEHMGLIRRTVMDGPLTINGITITSVMVEAEQAVSVFVFEQGGKKLVYAPCDCKPFPEDEIIRGADVLIMGNTFHGDELKGGRHIGPEHPLRDELYSFEGALALKERMCIGQIIFTHIEEDWGKTYDDYLEIEKRRSGVRFAYDGMVVEL